MKRELLGDVIIDRAIDFIQSHSELKQLEVQNEIDESHWRGGLRSDYAMSNANKS